MRQRPTHESEPAATPARGPLSGLAGQFGRPAGLAAKLIGPLLVWRGRRLNPLAVKLLQPRWADRVLEIGFGPGKAIRFLARAVGEGLVVGVDWSEAMVAQATRRNRLYMHLGAVDLHLGCVTALPFPDGRFTRALAVDSFQFWPDQARGLAEVRRVLAEKGRLLLLLRLRRARRGFPRLPGFTEQDLPAVEEMVRRAGFLEVRVERREAGVPVAAVFGTR